MSERLSKNRNKFVAVVTAAGVLIGGAVAVEGPDAYDSLFGRSNASATASCNTLPQRQIDEMAAFMQADFRRAHHIPIGTARNLYPSYTETVHAAAKFDLHMLPAIDQLFIAMKPDKAANMLSSLTTKEYGFPVTVHSDQSDALSDILVLEIMLLRTPMELVKAAHVSQIELDDTNLPPSDAADFLLDTSVMRFTPGHADAFDHELGHALAEASAKKHCGASILRYGDPNLAVANPPDFTYDNSDKNIAWQGITATRYGASGVAEDGAEIVDQILHPTANETCLYGRSPVLNEKIADQAARMNELAPGAGAFAVDQMLSSPLCS